YNGDGKKDVLVYSAYDGSLGMGISDGNGFNWSNAGNVANFGDMMDPSSAAIVGDFNGDLKKELTFYDKVDGNWWGSSSNGVSLSWHLSGNFTDGSSTSGVFNPAVVTIQAEAYASTGGSTGGVGTENCSEGSRDVMDVGDGEWAAYSNIDFDNLTSFQLRT